MAHNLDEFVMLQTVPKKSKVASRIHKNREHAAGAIRHHLKRKKSTILRPKQIPVVFSVAKKLEEGEDAVYLDLPTGTGKTVIFSQIVKAIMQDGWNPNTLIVTYSKELVKQTKQRFDEHASNVPVGLYYQHEKDKKKSVTVTTYNSFPHFAKYANKFDYVVFDEAHKVLSKERLKQMKKFKNAVKIALTASPAYSFDKTLEDHFALAYRMTVPEAIDNDLICSYRNIKVESDCADLDKVKLSSNGDYDERSLAKAVNIYSRNKAAVEFYQHERDPETGKPLLGKRGIANCVDVKHATDVAKLFNKHIKPDTIGGKTAAAVIHGGMSKKERERILQDHKDGKILLLMNADLLIHGYDDPTIELCLNLAPSRSLVKVSQRAGRALRLDKKNPNKVALIVDFLDQTSIEKQKGLLYGDIVGQAAYFHPQVEKRLSRKKGKKYFGGRSSTNSVDHKFLDKLKVFWNSEEVNSIIKKNKIIREQGSLEGRKQDDELSAFAIHKQEKVSPRIIRAELNKLILVKGKPGQYIHSDDESKKPFIYYGAERIGTKGKIRVLKSHSVRPFMDNHILKYRKQDDELSAADITKQKQAYFGLISAELNKLIPVKGKPGQYIHPNDKSKKPFIYYGAERMLGERQVRVLKKQSVRPFMDDHVLENKNKKKKDEFSANDIGNQEKISPKTIRAELDKLILVKGKPGQYIHRDDKSKKPFIYYGAERIGPRGIKIRVLKSHSVQPLIDNHILKDRKKEYGLSPIDIMKQEKVSDKIVRNELDKLIPVKGKPGQYIHPDDKSKKPFIYYGAERMLGKRQVRVLKSHSVRPLIDNHILKDRKKEGELSIVDISKQEKISNKIVRNELDKLIPVKGKPGQYIHPDDKSKKPFIYYGAERNGNKGEMRVLKSHSVQPLIDNHILKDRKKEDELSSLDLVDVLVIKKPAAFTLLRNYKPLKKNSNAYIHSSKKFKETAEMTTRKYGGKSFLCLKENFVDIVARQNDLEYRTPALKKKYEALAKQQPK